MNGQALFILSYKRAERLLKNTTTLQWVSPAWRAKTFLVVREDEETAYLPVVERFGVSLIAIPRTEYEGKEFYGWGETMDWIVEYACNSYEKFAIMDDDLKLSWRPKLLSREWLPMDEVIFNNAMECLMNVDYDTPFMGWRERQFSDTHVEEIEYNCRFIHAFALHSKFFKDHPQYRYTTGDIRHMPDLQLLLSLLTHGVSNCAYNRYCHDDIPDAEGGCSVIRTSEEHSKSACQLAKMFPGIVKLRQKNNWGEVRIGTLIQWKKAWRAYCDE